MSSPLSTRKYTRAELREILLDEQTRVSEEVLVRSARTFLSRALWDFRQECPQFHRCGNIMSEDQYDGCIRRMCSKIIYKTIAQRILNSPVRQPRLPRYALERLIWIKNHVGQQAEGVAYEIMQDTDFDVEEVILDVKSYQHEPDLPTEYFAFVWR